VNERFSLLTIVPESLAACQEVLNVSDQTELHFRNS